MDVEFGLAFIILNIRCRSQYVHMLVRCCSFHESSDLHTAIFPRKEWKLRKSADLDVAPLPVLLLQLEPGAQTLEVDDAIHLNEGSHGSDTVLYAFFNQLTTASQEVFFFESCLRGACHLHGFFKVAVFDLQIGVLGILKQEALVKVDVSMT